MQQTLSNELRSVIEKRLHAASPQQVLTIASALCLQELRIEAPFPPMSATPASRFEVEKHTVLDRRTGLMWMRQTMPGGHMPWAKAKEACSLHDLGGYTDWRLPTIRELLTIVDYERHEPAIDAAAFQCESAWYWSSTPYASSPGVFAWIVGFDFGYAGWSGQVSNGFVRACRAGQSAEHWF